VKHYTFIVYIGAEGESVDEAWERAVADFAEDPGDPKTWREESIEEGETHA
jgi:hypothetical protein